MGGSILQPYNTSNMYANLMQPRLYADGGEVHPPVAEFKPELLFGEAVPADKFVPASPVDQRFYDSQQYRDYQAKVSDPSSAYLQALHDSPYFGRFSSSQGGMMDAAYENYLANRAPDPVSVPAPDPIAGDNQIAPPSPPPTLGRPLPSSPPTLGRPLPSSPPTLGQQLPSSPPTLGAARYLPHRQHLGSRYQMQAFRATRPLLMRLPAKGVLPFYSRTITLTCTAFCPEI